MKKILLFALFGCLCTEIANADQQKEEYMARHSKNYDNGYIFTRDWLPDLPGKADVYDAEDFRAGALAACNEIQKHYGFDVCAEIGYWGMVGPRVTPEENEEKLQDMGL